MKAMYPFYRKLKLLEKSLKSCRYFLRRPASGLSLWNDELDVTMKHKIEEYWSDKLKTESYKDNDNSREKYYVLSMFPYPSGHLHMGHVRVYTISDTIARYQRMNGKNVIHPIGWDAFGLPAENAAIERQIAPESWTEQNIAHMKQQLKQLGCSFEWDRELATCDPYYYRWTQDLFLKLWDAGLAYQKEALVNWDPVDQTVLAEEQVDENGCSWRSGAKVEQKLLKQWFIRTTRFAKDLLDGLDDSVLHDWRDIIKLQKHWIGDCSGVAFDFDVIDNNSNIKSFISLWTDYPEYIENASFVAVTENNALAINERVVGLNNGTKELKVKAKNRLNGKLLPIFVTDEINFLEMTSSHLGIPGVTDQDTAFAERHHIPYETFDIPNTEEEKLTRQQLICQKAKELNAGGYRTSAKLRDWLISRQRYWGTPIPVVHCDNCGVQPVPRKDLPVLLPKLSKLSQKGKSLMDECGDWIVTSCPKCGGSAKRETDTMDTFVDSSWYYLRYIDPKNDEAMFDVQKAKKALPVDLYIGGKEHAVLHLYYARFISHFLYSLGLVPEREPFKRLLVQGMVMGKSFRLKGTGQYLAEEQVEIIDLKKNKAIEKSSGQPVVVSWEKMSKSKHNGVDPADMFREYGTDTTRLLILADVSPTSHRNWNSSTFPGILNWQKRLWLTIQQFLKYRNELPNQIDEEEFKKHDDYMFDSRNFYIKGTTFNYCTSQQISVAVSKLQGLTNSLRRVPPVVFARSLQFERALACQIILMAPMAPHFASELWSGFTCAPNRLNNTGEILWDQGVLEQKWPVIDSDYNLDLICQINNEENTVIKIPKYNFENMTKEIAMDMVLNHQQVKDSLNNFNIRKTSYVLYQDYQAIVNFYVPEILKLKKKQKKTV